MDVLRESRQAAPNTNLTDYLLKPVHNLRRTTSASLLEHHRTLPDETLLILANARTNANHVHLFSWPYQFRLDCHVRIAKTLALVERWRTRAFSRWGYSSPCPTKKGSYIVKGLTVCLYNPCYHAFPIYLPSKQETGRFFSHRTCTHGASWIITPLSQATYGGWIRTVIFKVCLRSRPGHILLFRTTFP